VDGVECHDNVFADSRVGLHVDNSPASLDLTHTFARNVFAYNDVAVGLMPSVRANRFVDNSFFDNIEQVAVFGGGDLRDNAFTVDGRGNYWSDYRGYDADRDGVGDVPHKVASVFENLMDRQPKLRLFLFSPAQQAVELASRAFPVVRPQVRAVDTAPRMRPIKTDAPALASSTGTGFSPAALLAGGTLLGLGGAVVTLARREIGQ
jgi:nitrous oxidase accessory protein